MISIRNRLVVMIFSVLMLCTALIAMLVSFHASEEFSEILDGSLEQIAVSAAAHNYEGSEYEASDKTSLSEEHEFIIQVWKHDALVYTSHPRINLPLQQEKGYGNIITEQQRVRYFLYYVGDRKIQVSQSVEERQELVEDTLYQFIVPIFMQLPVMMLLAYIVIGRGLRPLLIISSKMQERGGHNLSPIDIKNIPQEIFPLIQSLNLLLRRLEDSLKLQKEFTADAAHELRTPLTAIKLQIDLLERAEKESERQETQESLKAAIDRSIKLVQNLLLLARYEPDVLTIGREKVNLALIAKKVCKDLESLAQDKTQTLTFRNEAQETTILGQAENIFILIENLVQNAILYTQKGGRVDVNIQSDGAKVYLRVSDNGIGIKKSEWDRVFDRFYRCLGTMETGSGLGLSIVQNITEYHNGHIEIEEGLEGKGCCFTVAFPLLS
ncbi:MAG: sensor histidine kinase [Alphaproteobacteria bacterium]